MVTYEIIIILFNSDLTNGFFGESLLEALIF
jgi:hypothetical protein